MAKRAPQPYGYRELDEALRTAQDYVSAVRSAFAAQQGGVKEAELRRVVGGPIFVRKACSFEVDGREIVRKACALPLAEARVARRGPRKAKARG